MKLAAITFWREMPIVVTFLLLAMVYIVTAKDVVLRSPENNNPNHRYHANETEKKFPPRFKHPLKMYNKEMKPVGSSIKLKCAVEGNPTPNITWYKNKSTPIQRTYFQPGYGKWSMSLDELTKADDGNYTCVVCNELDCIEHSVELVIQERVYAKPVLLEGVVNQTQMIGETARFSCQFFSDMHLTVFWMFFPRHVSNGSVNSTDSSLQESFTNFDMDKIVRSENPNDKPEQLTIYNLTKEDEGWYECVALNALGSTTAQGYLTVLELTPTSINDASLKTSTASPTIPVNSHSATITANAGQKTTPTIDDENAKLIKTLKDMFDVFAKEQDRRFNEIRHSIDVMSAKYDEFYSKINCIEKERLEDKKTIKDFEQNIDELERNEPQVEGGKL